MEIGSLKYRYSPKMASALEKNREMGGEGEKTGLNRVPMQN